MSRQHPRPNLQRLLKALTLVLVWGIALPAFASAATVVSLEFDDGVSDQYQVKELLLANAMRGTFFVNSGVVGDSNHMSWAQLQSLAADGNEIGGHTVAHMNLTTGALDEVQREICNDRVNLTNHGFSVSDFAYPFAAVDAASKAVVQQCGYNSGRSVGGLQDGTYGEAIPPTDPYETITVDSVLNTWSVAQIETYVTQAEQHGAAWVQLVFHHICPTGAGCDTYGTTLETFTSLITWLRAQAGQYGTTFKTVHEVIGGPDKAAVPGPPPSPLPTGSNLVSNQSMEADANTDGIADCFQIGQYGTNAASMSRTTDAHSGTDAERLTVSDYYSGDAKILTQQDLGSCAPVLTAGTKYRISAWYKASMPTLFTLYTRNALGGWAYWTDSRAGSFPAATSWAQATWVTPPLPPGATGISFGLTLTGNGTVTADDYSMVSTVPVVSLNAPVNGATLAGTVAFAAAASDDAAVSRVDFLVDGKVVAAPSTAPYTASWNSAGVTDGTHSVSARALDTDGNAQISDSVQAMVDNTKPSSLATAPALVKTDSVPVSYTAADTEPASGVASVRLYVKAPGTIGYSEVEASDTSGSSSGSFNYSADGGDGEYSFYTVATDKAGNAEEAPSAPDVVTEVDTTAPISSAAAPVMSNSKSLTVSYAAADPTSQVARVELWAKAPGQASYGKADSSANASGSFSYIATAGDGDYSFYTVAADKAGNLEPAPSRADAVTVLETAAPSSSATVPKMSNAFSLTVSYMAQDAGSGVEKVDLYAIAPGQTDYTKVAARTSGDGSGSFSYMAKAGDGTYSFYTLATDRSGNAQLVPSGEAVTVVDTAAPVSSASVPTSVTQAPITVSFIASDTHGSGLARVDLYAKAPGASAFTRVASDTSSSAAGSWSYPADAGVGTYSFYTLATDKAGNTQATPASANASTLYKLRPALEPGKPVLSKLALTGVSARKARLAFTLTAGRSAPAVRVIAIKPPAGISFSTLKRNLQKGILLTATNGKRLAFTATSSRGILTITLRSPAITVRATVAYPATIVSTTLAQKVNRHQAKPLAWSITATDTKRVDTRIPTSIKPR